MAGTQQDSLAAALPLDDQPDMQALLRRRAVMQALLQNAIGPQQGQMVSGHYVAPSLLGNLARMATGYYANKGLEGVDAQERAMTQKYNAGMGRAAKQYMDLRTGTQDEPMGPPTADDQWGLQKGQPANPRAAIVAAMTSGYKPLQQIAMGDLTALGKREAETFPHQPIRTRDGKTVTVGNQATVRELPIQLPDEYMVVGDQIVPKSDPTKTPIDLRKKFKDERLPDGSLAKREITGTNDLDMVDKSPKVNVGVNLAGNEYLKKRGEGMAAEANTLQNRAAASAQTLRSIAQLREYERGGTFNNPTAGAATFMSQLGQTVGVKIDTAKMANSEAYRGEIRNLLIAQMQALGGAKGLSEKETQLVLEAFPNLERSAQARGQLLAVLEGKAKQAIAEYDAWNQAERRAYPKEPMFQMNSPAGVPLNMPQGPAAPAMTSPGQGPRVINWGNGG